MMLPTSMSFPLAQQPAATAMDTVWDLHVRWTWAPWFTVVFVAMAVILIVALYLRESSPAGPVARSLMVLLRLTSLGLVLLMISELMFFTSQQAPPHLHVVIDTSASMGLPAADAGPSRLEAAKQLLTVDGGAIIAQWHRDYQLHVAAAADGLSPIEQERADKTTEAINSLKPDGPLSSQSRLGDAIQSVMETGQEPPPAAVVLLTDGRTTAGRSLDEARATARRRGVPLYVVGLGSPEAPADLALSDVLADELALAGDLVAIEATLSSQGMGNQVVTVRAIDTSTGETAAEVPVEIQNNTIQPVQVMVRPDRTGQITYRIEVTGPTEEQDTSNNQIEHTIEVRDEQLQVLVAAGYPNYEYRYLHTLLTRDSTFELSTFLQEADVEHAMQEASAIAQLPLKIEEIEKYDVLVLIDLDPRLLSPRWWQNVEHLVVKRGGGLVLVAGPRHFPYHYRGVSEIENLAPIDTSSVTSPGGVTDRGFALELTSLGQQKASMQLGATQAESLTIWESLPPQYWFSDPQQVKPAAQILAVHPAARTEDGRPVPLFCLQYVGAGRVLYHGVDSTWRWRYRVGDAWFARYWGQSLRHLARSRISDGQDGAEIIVDSHRFELGEPVRLQVRLPPEEGTAAGQSAELFLEADGQPPRRVTLASSRLAPHLLHGTATNLPPGNYRVRLEEPPLTPAPDSVEFEVRAPPGELVDTTMNEAGLNRLARETYGRFYTREEAGQLAGDLPKGTRATRQVQPPLELWNQWWMLAAITACLSLEWVLRKRKAML